MTAVLCLEDKGGMSFGGKRLSRDKLLCDELIKIVGNATLYVKEVSASLFSSEKVAVTEDFTAIINTDDFCFVEKWEDLNVVQSADCVIVYRWNRRYPFDKSFDFDMLSGKKVVSTRDFAGNSHPVITEEIYK